MGDFSRTARNFWRASAACATGRAARTPCRAASALRARVAAPCAGATRSASAETSGRGRAATRRGRRTSRWPGVWITRRASRTRPSDSQKTRSASTGGAGPSRALRTSTAHPAPTYSSPWRPRRGPPAVFVVDLERHAGDEARRVTVGRISGSAHLGGVAARPIGGWKKLSRFSRPPLLVDLRQHRSVGRRREQRFNADSRARTSCDARSFVYTISAASTEIAVRDLRIRLAPFGPRLEARRRAQLAQLARFFAKPTPAHRS